ncbi:MAG TPA: ABC transporter ATP-binding protein [Thermoanaerobaculia bacterium]|jgi:ABC-type multidrug transport system ATPase subunit|nr:ABC transporter ATP-binding protein [Thermoanaerobaculia bacterium]
MPRFEATKLAKAFDGPPIFRDVSLEAERGLVAVTGRNGSGKSTLLKIFAGLMRPSRGSVAIWRDGAKLPENDRAHEIGFASPELEFIDELTATENLSLLSRAAGRPAAARGIGELLDAFGLARPAHGRRVGEFSSGMKQRVRLAFSLLLDPPVLLWDEPYSNLDTHGIDAARTIMNARRETGLVILATNDRRDIEDADDEVSLS